MTSDDHEYTFNGLPVWDFDGGELKPGTAVKVSVEYGEDSNDDEVYLGKLEAVAAQPAAAELTALVLGHYEEMFDRCPDDIYAWLVANAGRFPALTALFLLDVTGEECEISWIQSSDPAPLIEAFPGLEVLETRGWTPLSTVTAPALRRLSFETGGLPSDALEGVVASDLPALEDLELWLGVEQYGRTTTLEHLRPLLDDPPTSLRALRLRNADDAGDLLAAVLAAPVLARLHTLDLSMGTLLDDQARQLLTGPSLEHLTTIELSENYLSEECLAELTAAGLPVVSHRQREPWIWDGEPQYYPSVTE